MFTFLLGALAGSIVTVAVPRVASASAIAFAWLKAKYDSARS